VPGHDRAVGPHLPVGEERQRHHRDDPELQDGQDFLLAEGARKSVERGLHGEEQRHDDGEGRGEGPPTVSTEPSQERGEERNGFRGDPGVLGHADHHGGEEEARPFPAHERAHAAGQREQREGADAREALPRRLRPLALQAEEQTDEQGERAVGEAFHRSRQR
jgi:hypothetical protein